MKHKISSKAGVCKLFEVRAKSGCCGHLEGRSETVSMDMRVVSYLRPRRSGTESTNEGGGQIRLPKRSANISWCGAAKKIFGCTNLQMAGNGTSRVF